MRKTRKGPFGVPLYSQILDVPMPRWKKNACGIVALKSAMDYWGGNTTFSAAALIREGLRFHSYIPEVGWKHKGLAALASRHGFWAKNYDWAKDDPRAAWKRLLPHLRRYPVLASIYKDFSLGKSGHLVVLSGFRKGMVFYNDPIAEERGGIARRAPLQKFLHGWKRRIIVVRPKRQPIAKKARRS